MLNECEINLGAANDMVRKLANCFNLSWGRVFRRVLFSLHFVIFSGQKPCLFLLLLQKLRPFLIILMIEVKKWQGRERKPVRQRNYCVKPRKRALLCLNLHLLAIPIPTKEATTRIGVSEARRWAAKPKSCSWTIFILASLATGHGTGKCNFVIMPVAFLHPGKSRAGGMWFSNWNLIGCTPID